MSLFLLFTLLVVGTGAYSYLGYKASLFHETKALSVTYVSVFILIATGVVLFLIQAKDGYKGNKLLANIFWGIAFSLITACFLSTVLFFIEDLTRGFIWLFHSAFHFKVVRFIPRSHISGLLALALSGITILTVNYGIWFGRYRFKTHHLTVEYNDLPKSFDGFLIAQISDMHLGTFDRMKCFQKGLDQLQQLKPDLIVFTGDMVNSIADEALPYIENFKKLHAPYGKFSVLGNHDYGKYYQWNSQQDKAGNLSKLKEIESKMGFTLLNNQHVVLHKNDDSIIIAGVENWGLPPFPHYGDLSKAMEGVSAGNFTVLLSHDPTYWSEKVVNFPVRVQLTLSGHTHGMQLGIETGKFRWSPAKYLYHNWAGLYTGQNCDLYVNRGFGTLGYPGRIGIWPEITIIKLCRKAIAT